MARGNDKLRENEANDPIGSLIPAEGTTQTALDRDEGRKSGESEIIDSMQSHRVDI